MTSKPYLAIHELAMLTPWTVEAIRAKLRRGELRLGEHYFQETHRGRLIFKWDAIVGYIEGEPVEQGLPAVQSAGPVSASHCSETIDVEKAKTELHRLLHR